MCGRYVEHGAEVAAAHVTRSSRDPSAPAFHLPFALTELQMPKLPDGAGTGGGVSRTHSRLLQQLPSDTQASFWGAQLRTRGQERNGAVLYA